MEILTKEKPNPSNITLSNFLGMGWKWTKRIYLSALLATTLHAGYDFFTDNLHKIKSGNTMDYLQVREYTVDVGEEKKKLTLLGEIHFYSERESQLAKELIEKHDTFASETGEGEKISFGNSLFEMVIALPIIPTYLFYRLGSGRFYWTASDLAKQQREKVYALEEDPFRFLSVKEKIYFFGSTVFDLALAPVSYWEGKYENPYSPQKYSTFPFKRSLLDKRDEVMAESLADLLKKDDTHALLASVGAAHLEGVIKNLREEVKIQETK